MTVGMGNDSSILFCSDCPDSPTLSVARELVLKNVTVTLAEWSSHSRMQGCQGVFRLFYEVLCERCREERSNEGMTVLQRP